MRLRRDQYVASVAADGRRLGEVAVRGLDAPVPSCPGWTVADLVRHTGIVHRHKERIVRERLLADPERDVPPGDEELVEWYLDGVERLVGTLAAGDPSATVTTFHPPDQSIGFWQRRMAHETAIHRVDAELAHDALSPLDASIAADGVDEVMSSVRAGVGPEQAFESDGRIVVLHAGDTGDTWHCELGQGPKGTGWRWQPGGSPAATTVITATADVLDRWVWGRADEVDLSIDGDPTTPAVIRDVVAGVT